MGAGFAKKVKELYPGAAEADKLTLCGDIKKLGNYSVAVQKHVFYSQKIIIVNAYTQYRYSKGSRSVSYPMLKSVFTKMNKDFQGMTITMPKIGCGLGGGDWEIVRQLIELYLNACFVTVYEWDIR